MTNEILFSEKQFLGRDHRNLSLRLIVALFCFIVYAWQDEHRSQENDLFLIAGIGILLISIVLMFMVHFRTTVTETSLELDGLWTTRKVKIDLKSIVKVQETVYSSFFVNNPVYNLHRKGSIRFYAGGKNAVKITDREGLKYIIGTHRPKELATIIQGIIHA